MLLLFNAHEYSFLKVPYLETRRVDEYKFTQYLRFRGEFPYSLNSNLYAVNFSQKVKEFNQCI